ncbi:MAG: hypothetical protein QM820_33385 [Minicystis sp.]
MSTSEETIEDIVRKAAAPDGDAPDDPRWHALAAGTLSADEVAALRAEAETSAEGRLLWDLYRPFEDRTKERLFARLQAKLPRPEPTFLQRIARWWKGLPPGFRLVPATIGFVGAAAAATPLYLAQRQPDVEVAWSNLRGREDPPAVLSTPDATFAAIVVPQGTIKGPLAVRGSLLVRDGQPRPWDAQANPPAADNVIVIAGPKKKLFPCVPAGEWDLLVAVGKPGAPLPAAELIRRAGKGSAGSYQVLQRRVVLEGERVDANGQPCSEDAR